MLNRILRNREGGYLELFARPYRAASFTSMMAVFIGSLDSLIIGTSLPTISQRLHGAELYAAVLGAYMIANLTGLPLFGAMSDRTGPWRVFLLASAIFGAGSLLGGFAPTMLLVVAARGVQGFGAGGLYAVAYAAIGRQIPKHLQPNGFGLMSGIWGASSLIGPSFGALVLATLGWRWVFWFNVPLVLVILPAARAAFAGVAQPVADQAPNNIRGPVLLGLIAGAAVAAFSASLRWLGPLVALAILGLVLFVLQERVASRPVLAALRRPGGLGAGAVITGCLTGISLVVVQAYLPLFVQAGRGEPVITAALILTVGSVFWTVGSVSAARLIGRGTRWLLAVGHLSFCSGTVVLMICVAARLPISALVAGFILTGTGIGLLTPCLFTMALADVGPGAEGSATSGVQVLRALGGSLGAGIAGLTFRISVPADLYHLLADSDPAGSIRAAGLSGFLDSALVHCWLVAFLAMGVSAAVVLRLPAVWPKRATSLEPAS